MSKKRTRGLFLFGVLALVVTLGACPQESCGARPASSATHSCGAPIADRQLDG